MNSDFGSIREFSNAKRHGKHGMTAGFVLFFFGNDTWMLLHWVFLWRLFGPDFEDYSSLESSSLLQDLLQSDLFLLLGSTHN